MTLLPDYKTFCRLAGKGNLVAVSASIPADLETPVSAYLKIAHKLEHSFLLESAEQGERVGRYSFIGLQPEKIFRAQAQQVEIFSKGKNKAALHTGVQILDLLAEEMRGQKLANEETLPDFCGGFVGYLSYENVTQFESICFKDKPSPEMPQALFFLTREFLVFDHFRKSLAAVVVQEIPLKKSASSLKKAYQQARRKIERALNRMQKPLSGKKLAIPDLPPMISNMKPRDFYQKVSKVREYIRAGDCIQVVLSQRFRTQAPREDFQIYRALRSINPSPYMFYFKSGKTRLIGSSPEMLVKKKGRTVEVRPIAGTRPRSVHPKEDQSLEENLKKSSKELAEHLMLVDLGRNDLGRVCEFKSVEVKNFARIERYSHVMHLVSDVAGRLKPGKSSFDVLKATFPAGTVSGAPKIRAMEIIHELEEEGRGPYAGCLGYFSYNQNMDMCITIRTLASDGKHLYLQAGAGIVKDSQPKREYEETVNKARALMRALELQKEFSCCL